MPDPDDVQLTGDMAHDDDIIGKLLEDDDRDTIITGGSEIRHCSPERHANVERRLLKFADVAQFINVALKDARRWIAKTTAEMRRNQEQTTQQLSKNRTRIEVLTERLDNSIKNSEAAAKRISAVYAVVVSGVVSIVVGVLVGIVLYLITKGLG